MKREDIPLKETGFFNRIILDMVDGNAAISPFFGLSNQMASYQVKIEERSVLPIDRHTLADSLVAQYAAVGHAEALVLKNIESLRDDNTFTVTTGHQLNIFTGPLYFVYKILHTIRLADSLKKSYPEQNFVPVFWMATEDHDLAEVSFFHLFGKKYEWTTDQTGAVGRMRPDGLQAICDELGQVLSGNDGAISLVQIFREAYALRNMADATRYVANALFGKYGLVVLDGDHPKLKRLFLDAMLKDAFDQTAFHSVMETNRQLSALHYQTQINPREINLFYLTDQVRDRIVRTESGFHVLHSDIRWTGEDMRAEMRLYPERFSPNVVLRPMYQERILPNLAYVGGAGELAYWLQLKASFAQLGCSYPILALRNHLLLLDEQTSGRMTELNIVIRDLFHSVDELIRAHVLESVDADMDLTEEQRLLSSIYERLKVTAAGLDVTLVASLDAELARQRQTIGQWGARFGRVLKKKNETSVERIRKLHSKLFPNNSLQERHDNLLHYARSNNDLIADLHDTVDPFANCLGVVRLD